MVNDDAMMIHEPKTEFNNMAIKWRELNWIESSEGGRGRERGEGRRGEVGTKTVYVQLNGLFLHYIWMNHLCFELDAFTVIGHSSQFFIKNDE